MPFKVSSEKLVTTEALRDLTQGSYEHLSLRLDDAILENSKFFTGDVKSDVARIATFKDRVVVGTSDGRYLSARYEDVDGQIHFGGPETLDVPMVDSVNVSEYVDSYVDKIVNSLMIGDKDEGKEQILALINLKESVDDNSTDLASLVFDIVSGDSDWKRAYRENLSSIRGQLGNIAESIDNAQIEVKYSPLYNGTLPEEKFHLYLEPAKKDLGVIGSRLSTLENKVESVYLPFVEIANSTVLEGDDKDTVSQFVGFAEGLTSEIHDLREHVKIAVENEQCAMCLGQIHDAIADNLTDYEIAGSFVEHMATLFSSSV